MAFALTKFKTFGVPLGSSTRRETIQEAELIITGTAADVSLDISNSAGTFWTAALADATYGALATTALAVLTKIAGEANALHEIEDETLLTKVKVFGAPGANQYSITITGHLPTITYPAAAGSLSYVLKLQWAMPDNVQPVTADLGAAA